MNARLDEFTDAELLVLCELADEIATQGALGKPLTDAEAGFLAILSEKGLWAPEGRG